MAIIDRRKSGRGKSTANRKKFIQRYKRSLKKRVDAVAERRTIGDLANSDHILVDSGTTDEPSFRHATGSGKQNIVLPGNERFKKGDTIRRPPQDSGGGGAGSGNGDGDEDPFYFTLTKKEFLDLYFADMKLPNFVKRAIKGEKVWKWKRTGYSKDGIPARLNIKKTFEMAMARRIATKAQGKKPRFLDDVDIRYNHFTKQAEPKLKAVMFCLMDVSGSMGEHEKTLAKKFYLLLYLFLEQVYDNVELVFLCYTHEAKEVDEHNFFYNRSTGGTVVSTGLALTREIIAERYDPNTTNIYVAHASDGDNMASDMAPMMEEFHKLLPMVQYYAYIDILTTELSYRAKHPEYYIWHRIRSLADQYEHLQAKRVAEDSDIYPVLRELFTIGE